jgi:PII interaction protein X
MDKPPQSEPVPRSPETYLNHPSFGLLHRICVIDSDRELYATLYAQRLFFLVSAEPPSLKFDAISRADARILVETRLRELRRLGNSQELSSLQLIQKRTF